MSTAVAIEAKNRELSGTGAARRYRRDGLVPGVFYVDGHEAVPLLFDHKKLAYFLHHAHGLVDLKITGEQSVRKCVLKEVQYDPVSDEAVHVDFLGVKMGEKLHLSVPLVLSGTPEGEKAGGILQHLVREISIECLPKHIPESLEVDISHLSIGKSIQIKELEFENLTILSDPNETIALVELPKAAISEMEEAEEVVEEEETEEPEVISRAKEEE